MFISPQVQAMRLPLIVLTGILFVHISSAQFPARIKVMTYNINAEKHGSGSYSDISDVIREIDPDIAGFQKIDSCNDRNSSYVLGWLGEQTDRSAFYTPAIKNYNGSNGSYGVGFLTKEEPQSIRRLWIEHTSSEQDRGVIELTVTLGGQKARIIVTHVAHEGASYRTTQIKKIIEWIDSTGTDDPVIIMADFNAAPTESSMKQFETAGFNYVKGADGTILDTTNGGINHILYRPEPSWKLIDAGNPDYAASNRNPVWADIEIVPTAVGHRSLSISRHTSNERYCSCISFDLTGRKTGTVPISAVHENGVNPDVFTIANRAPGTMVITFTGSVPQRAIRSVILR